MRIYCARIEAYDLPLSDKDSMDTQLKILASFGEDDARVAKALLKLGVHVKGNQKLLEGLAQR